VKLDPDLLAKAAGFERFEPITIKRFEQYAALLIETNSKINLISRSVEPSIEIPNQIAISLIARRLCPPGSSSWIDIGSGGGFPVVPVAIAEPSIQFTAVEPTAKKAYFIERTAQELGLENLRVVVSRMEEFVDDKNDRQWNVVSIKAVTDLDRSLFWCSQLLNSSGMAITYKPNDVTPNESLIIARHGFEHTCSLDVKEVIDTINLYVVACKKR